MAVDIAFGRRLLSRFLAASNKVAVISGGWEGKPVLRTSYSKLLASATSLASQLAEAGEWKDNDRVGLWAPPGPEYVCGMLAIWLNGGAVVPFSLSSPLSELEYVVSSSGLRTVLVTDDEHAQQALLLGERTGAKVLRIGGMTDSSPSITEDMLASIDRAKEERMSSDAGALVIYTSGSTGRPKGALHTHGSLGAQTQSLDTAWEWQAADRIIHPLPLHHIHGIVNGLLCPLVTGATVEFLPRFSPKMVWTGLIGKDRRDDELVTVFMGVPTMFVRLLQVYDSVDDVEREKMRTATARLRLTISGSAACPVPLMKRWEEVSGTKLLERYGMTEIGMALSNPYRGERKPGSVGTPLPGVTVKIVPFEDEKSTSEKREEEGGEEVGELLVKSPGLFKEYIGRAAETAAAFDSDGWFRTSDCVSKGPDGVFTILGRSSVDIIKFGGYKLSALEIESHLLTHPNIAEVAILGIEDYTYGEIVAALVVLNEKSSPTTFTLSELKEWSKTVMATYKCPSLLQVTDKIPRNAMGKVNKKELKKLFNHPTL